MNKVDDLKLSTVLKNIDIELVSQDLSVFSELKYAAQKMFFLGGNELFNHM